jgi:hypothetical protein
MVMDSKFPKFEDCVLPKTFVDDITEITGTGEIDYYYGLNWSTKERVE